MHLAVHFFLFCFVRFYESMKRYAYAYFYYLTLFPEFYCRYVAYGLLDDEIIIYQLMRSI